MIRELSLRIILVDPPRGVEFCLQHGKSELVPPVSHSDDKITFELTVSFDDAKTADPPNFRGPFAQGRPGEKFVYINSGTYAGHSDSPWSRRAKVPLKDITWEMIKKTLSKSNAMLEASLAGAGKDGGPVCATVHLLGKGWRVQTT